MTNVLMISGSFPPDKCGVGDYTKILCNNLHDKSVGINVISSFSSGDEKYHLNTSVQKWSFSCIKKIFEVVDEIKPDIVHIQYPTKAYRKSVFINFLPIALILKKCKVVTTIHEYSDNSLLGKIRVIPNLLFSNSIIVVDPVYKKDIIKLFPFIKNKVRFINIASNIPKSQLLESEKLAFKKTIINDKSQRILGYFGFVNESKNIEVILEALADLKSVGELKTKLLMIAELEETNEYHGKLIKLIEEYNLKEDVTITGYLNEKEVADYITIADYFILPFKNGFSPKNGSALAALQEGKMVVSTLPKSKVNNLNNLIFLQTAHLKNELIELIKKFQNSNIHNSSNKNSTYCWDDVSDKHIKLYNKLLS